MKKSIKSLTQGFWGPRPLEPSLKGSRRTQGPSIGTAPCKVQCGSTGMRTMRHVTVYTQVGDAPPKKQTKHHEIYVGESYQELLQTLLGACSAAGELDYGGAAEVRYYKKSVYGPGRMVKLCNEDDDATAAATTAAARSDVMTMAELLSKRDIRLVLRFHGEPTRRKAVGANRRMVQVGSNADDEEERKEDRTPRLTGARGAENVQHDVEAVLRMAAREEARLSMTPANALLDAVRCNDDAAVRDVLSRYHQCGKSMPYAATDIGTQRRGAREREATVEANDGGADWRHAMTTSSRGDGAQDDGDAGRITEGHLDQALLLSAWKGFAQVAELLLDAGADANAKDHRGDSALIKAASYHRVGVVRVLLEHGADANTVDGRGLTPLQHGRYNPEVKALLEPVTYGHHALRHGKAMLFELQKLRAQMRDAKRMLKTREHQLAYAMRKIRVLEDEIAMFRSFYAPRSLDGSLLPVAYPSPDVLDTFFLEVVKPSHTKSVPAAPVRNPSVGVTPAHRPLSVRRLTI